MQLSENENFLFYLSVEEVLENRREHNKNRKSIICLDFLEIDFEKGKKRKRKIMRNSSQIRNK